MRFGEKLRRHRLEKGLTQAELARIAGLGTNTITNYENGRTYPQNRQVYATLASILDVDPDYLRNENDAPTEAAQGRYGYSGREQAMLLVEEMSGLFSGGALSEAEIDGVMRAVQDLYWRTKEEKQALTGRDGV